jgi:gliding motility-associated lipoprotein GldB
MKNLIWLPTIILFLIACEGKDKECQNAPDVNAIEVELNLERLEKELFSFKTKDEIKSFLDRNLGLKELFLGADQYPHDSLLVNSLLGLISDPFIDTLYQETLDSFHDTEAIENEFKSAFRHLKYYYPNFVVPKIQTMVTGFGSDLYVSDSLIVLGLDYYIGENASYRPVNLPNYILKRYRKEYLVPSVMLLLSTHFNNSNPRDNSMLAEMLYYGKANYFTSKILPCTNDSLIMFYSGEELKDIAENQDVIWANFVENEMLYETSHIMKEKFLGERPKVYEIGEKCPGRIGRWVGWQIVNKYVEKTGASLPELMRSADAQIIFRNSGYKPS